MKMRTTSQDVTPSPEQRLWGFFAGLILLILLGFAARWVKGQVYNASLPLQIPGKALEYPLWAVLLGLAANVLLKQSGLYKYFRPGFRTELFLKIGLVLLGAGISFKEMVSAGSDRCGWSGVSQKRRNNLCDNPGYPDCYPFLAWVVAWLIFGGMITT